MITETETTPNGETEERKRPGPKPGATRRRKAPDEWPAEDRAYATGWRDRINGRDLDPVYLDPDATSYTAHRHYLAGYRDRSNGRPFKVKV